MAIDIFMLDIPNFVPKYKNDTLYSYEGKGREKLKEVLTEASKGHCMYCYTKIVVDRKNFGVLEHSVEKYNCDKLKNCPSNISIACHVCNGSFKRKGEKMRALTETEVKDFEIFAQCGVTCIESCSKYNEVRRAYTEKEEGQIILQPFGIKNGVTKREYLIQYDLLNQKFIPSKGYPYNEEEKKFIQKHINRFNLNDSKYRTKEFVKFLEDAIEYKVIPKSNRYNNLVVDLFIEKIQGFSKEKSIKICEIIYTQILMKSKN